MLESVLQIALDTEYCNNLYLYFTAPTWELEVDRDDSVVCCTATDLLHPCPLPRPFNNFTLIQQYEYRGHSKQGHKYAYNHC